MAEYNFKKLSEVEALTEVPEGANAFIEVNGEIKRVSGDGLGGGVFRVNLTSIGSENQYSADKTFAEIVAAYKSGMEVEAVTVESAEGSEFIAIYRLTIIDSFDNLIVFTSAGSMFGEWYVFELVMDAEGVVTVTNKKIS